VASNGTVYGIPACSGSNPHNGRLLEVDPTSGSTSSVGSNIGGMFEWWGGVVGQDGTIYGVPHDAQYMFSFDPDSRQSSFLAIENFFLGSSQKFSGGVTANNGIIYFIPSSYKRVVRFDPSNQFNPLSVIGNDYGIDEWKWSGGVLGPDGNIYCVPYDSFQVTQVLKINPNNDSTSLIGEAYAGSLKWFGGALAKDGNIYACPHNANKILQIKIEDGSTNLVGPDLGNTFGRWSGFVEGSDGFLYGTPYMSDDLLRFDPISHNATLFPLDENMQGFQKWRGNGVLADNGSIYFAPYFANQVLEISFNFFLDNK